jgi:NADH-quinone oxidoreductase subunit J
VSPLFAMSPLFVIASAVAVAATAMVVTRPVAVHALMYLVVSLLALALDFWLLGAPLVAAFEVIVYAGAILVLFVFVVMLIGGGRPEGGAAGEGVRAPPSAWLGPSLLALVLLGEIGWLAWQDPSALAVERWIGPKEVAVALYGPYVLGVEAASFLLLAALVAAWHLGRAENPPTPGGPR